MLQRPYDCLSRGKNHPMFTVNCQFFSAIAKKGFCPRRSAPSPGFSRAVWTDEPDAVAVVDGAGDVVEKSGSAEVFGDILRDQDRWHPVSLRRRDIQST
jgi:hypothetical protein